MRPWLCTLAATSLALASSGTAFADVAPDPVETASTLVVALAVLGLLIFGGLLALRFNRNRSRAAGKK